MNYETYRQHKQQLGNLLDLIKKDHETICDALTFKQYHRWTMETSLNYFDRARYLNKVTKNRKILQFATKILEREQEFTTLQNKTNDLKKLI
jgi:hypothetical protein